MGSTTLETGSDASYDVIVVGAGISGVNTGYRLQEQLPHLKFTILEARDAMGGTWDFFKYPGLRSDSDLHTFGFPWRPWPGVQNIADGHAISTYIRESAAAYGIDKKIQYRHRVLAGDWSSDEQAWRWTIDNDGKKKTYRSRFVIMSTGYYDYKDPLPAAIPGLKSFKGEVIHPQFWPEKLDYTDKDVVIIGSGATAITLLPGLAEKAAHVTMLQRSPSYILSQPQNVTFLHYILPAALAHKLSRLQFLIVPWLFFLFCRNFPNAARWALKKRTERALPKHIPHDPHFNPSYNPWEQRLCVCPDGDFFKTLHTGRASIATGHIKTVTDKGIMLQDDSFIKCDMIITATGLKIQMVGGTQLRVDGKPINIGDKFVWNGSMIQDVPNAALMVGYTNASWTLGADATGLHLCRLLRYMDDNKITSAVPRVPDGTGLKAVSLLNLNSTYVKKATSTLPHAGDRGPWKPRSNYFKDLYNAKYGDLTDGLELYKVSL